MSRPTILLNGDPVEPRMLRLERGWGKPSRAQVTVDGWIPALGEEVRIAARMNSYPRGGWRRLLARFLRRPLYVDYALATMVVDAIEPPTVYLRDPLADLLARQDGERP